MLHHPGPAPQPAQHPPGQHLPRQPYGAPSWPLPATPPRRYGLGTVLGAAAGAALLAGLMGLGTGAGITYAVMSQPDEPAAAARPAAEVLPERLPELVAWVEDRVGVPFAQEPRVEVLDDVAFEQALAADSTAAEPQSLPQDDYPSTVHTLGLVPDLDAYEGYYSSTFVDGVVGFYDSGGGRLAVRGTEWTPEVEVTVVHELVHALQDQAVDLDARVAATRLEDETYLGLTSVIEGQATAVEDDWLVEQTQDYQDEFWADDGGLDDGGLDDSAPYDPFADAMSYLPYDLGWLAVTDLEETSGAPATLEALRAAPTTTEQLYDLSGWRDGDDALADPVAVTEPTLPSGADVVDRGTLGVVLLGLLPLEAEELFPVSELDPIEGWAGDRYVTWELAGRTCTRAAVDLDDPDAAADLVERLQDWLDAADGTAERAVRSEADAVEVEACVDTP